MKKLVLAAAMMILPLSASAMDCNNWTPEGVQYCEISYRDGAGYYITHRIRWGCIYLGETHNCTL